MAAVDPSVSPKRLNSPADEEVTCGENTEAEESVCTLNQKDETSASKTTGSPDEVQRTSPGNDGGCTASHSEVSVESGAGADHTTCNSPENPPTAEGNTEAPGSEQRDLDWSEAEENHEEAPKQKQENDKCGMLTLLMYFIVSFSSQANLSPSYLSLLLQLTVPTLLT